MKSPYDSLFVYGLAFNRVPVRPTGCSLAGIELILCFGHCFLAHRLDNAVGFLFGKFLGLTSFLFPSLWFSRTIFLAFQFFKDAALSSAVGCRILVLVVLAFPLSDFSLETFCLLLLVTLILIAGLSSFPSRCLQKSTSMRSVMLWWKRSKSCQHISSSHDHGISKTIMSMSSLLERNWIGEKRGSRGSSLKLIQVNGSSIVGFSLQLVRACGVAYSILHLKPETL